MSGPMDMTTTAIDGCVLLTAPASSDDRGRFVKVLDADAFRRAGLATTFAEQYYTVSGGNVLRGMHLQLPPFGHDKLVYCVTGRVLDAVLDLRVGSPTYGRHETFELSAGVPRMLYIREGIAHGFCVLEAPATMVYNVTSSHQASHDSGVRWDSAGIDWPLARPLISVRDAGLPELGSFESPFRFRGPGATS
jgi:dTDP-4-dehydrorhamnose 3,5-epimerase